MQWIAWLCVALFVAIVVIRREAVFPMNAVNSAEEFDELVDEFADECKRLDRGEGYDPNRKYAVVECERLRQLIKQAYREVLSENSGT